MVGLGSFALLSAIRSFEAVNAHRHLAKNDISVAYLHSMTIAEAAFTDHPPELYKRWCGWLVLHGASVPYDWTKRLAHLAEALQAIPWLSAVIDGDLFCRTNLVPPISPAWPRH